MMLTAGSYKFLLKTVLLGGILLLGFKLNENKPVIVENKQAVLVYHLVGGYLKDFHLKQNTLNPFSISEEQQGKVQLVINREGTKHDSTLIWELINSPIQKGNGTEFLMKADFLRERLTVKRLIKLANERTGFHVKEEIFNYDSKENRIAFNQKIPLNGEFLNESKVYSNLEGRTAAQSTIKKKDLVKVEDGSSLKWVIIANHKKGILLGFVWAGSDYSNITFEKIHNHPVLSLGEMSRNEHQLLESKGLVSKSYFCFLQPISKDFMNVTSLQPVNGMLILETDGGKRKFELGEVEVFD